MPGKDRNHSTFSKFLAAAVFVVIQQSFVLVVYEFEICFLRSLELFFSISDIDIGTAVDIKKIRIYRNAVIKRIENFEVVSLLGCPLSKFC